MQGPRDTTRRGELSEFEIIAALLRSGRVVLRPLSAGLRYDLVIDNEDGTFARVQCKTGVLRQVPSCSIRAAEPFEIRPATGSDGSARSGQSGRPISQ